MTAEQELPGRRASARGRTGQNARHRVETPGPVPLRGLRSARAMRAVRGIRPGVAAAVAVAGALALGLGLFAGSAVVAVAAAADLAVLTVACVRIRPVWSAPGLIVSAYTAVIGFAGLLVGNQLGTVGTGDVRVILTRDQLAWTFVLFMTASVLLVLPSVLIWHRLPVAAMRDVRMPKQLDRWLLGAAAAVTLVAIALLGPMWILSRSSRFEGSSVVSSVALLAALGAVVALGAPMQRGKRLDRVVAIVLLVLLSSLFFSAASRFLCLVPLALLVGRVVLGGLRHHLLRTALITGVVAVVLLPVPLYLRGATSSGGILPYLAVLPAFRLNASSLAEYANNVLVSFRITGATMFAEQRMPLAWLWTSLAPGSGSSVGWYTIAPRMRLNVYSPYSGLGELANWGFVPLLGVLILIGVVFAAFAAWSVYMSRSPLGAVVGAAVVGVQVLFAVQFTQYNLRASMRLLYYSIVIEVIVTLAYLVGSRLLRHRNRRRGKQEAA